jgi:hypothetical protein
MGLDERIGCNENGLFWRKIGLFERRFAVDPMPPISLIEICRFNVEMTLKNGASHGTR